MLSDITNKLIAGANLLVFHISFMKIIKPVTFFFDLENVAAVSGENTSIKYFIYAPPGGCRYEYYVLAVCRI